METQAPFIGRKAERAILNEALHSPEAEMIAVVGRRRVGKTFLITQTYASRIVFELTGVQRASLDLQLTNFQDQLNHAMGANLPLSVPKNWLEAFRMLRQYLQTRADQEKVVLFIDELPWLANPKSGFLEALGYFWNSWASRQKIVIVLCGSAASWMIQKVVRDTGGLHNRITRRIHLEPFSLGETEQYLKSQGSGWDRYSILQLYMVTGGIPHYLKSIKSGLSPMQVIDQMCFTPSGLLRDEFIQLYPALFKNSSQHIAVIRTLFNKKSGLTRQELMVQMGLSSGGNITTTLEELEQSGFISVYYPYGKKVRDKVWRLTDEYSIFFLQFIEDKVIQKELNWLSYMDTQAYRIWCGFAFENICLRHLKQIKKALGISGVYTEASVFYKKGSKEEPGAQIDLVLERKDRMINLFEIKFYNDLFFFGQENAADLRRKQAVFVETTHTRKYISWVLITSFGLKNPGALDHVLTMDALFED
jgi:uncharacterized protein